MNDNKVYQEALAYDRERLRRLKEGYGDFFEKKPRDSLVTQWEMTVAWLDQGHLTDMGSAIETLAKRMAYQVYSGPEGEEDEGHDQSAEDACWRLAWRPETRQAYRQRAEELLKMMPRLGVFKVDNYDDTAIVLKEIW